MTSLYPEVNAELMEAHMHQQTWHGEENRFKKNQQNMIDNQQENNRVKTGRMIFLSLYSSKTLHDLQTRNHEKDFYPNLQEFYHSS
jgi:hypothetical protein